MEPNPNDHDLLMQLVTDMCWIKKNLGNHLKHHWVITMLAVSALFSVVATVIISLVRSH